MVTRRDFLAVIGLAAASRSALAGVLPAQKTKTTKTPKTAAKTKPATVTLTISGMI